jgi:quinol monooxygenase YgiN
MEKLHEQILTDRMDKTLLVTFHVNPSHKEQFKNALLDDMDGARRETGNLSMELFHSKEAPDTFYFYERWKNKEDLNDHLTRDYTKHVFDIAAAALKIPMNIKYLEDLSPISREEYKYPSEPEKAVDLVVNFTVKEGQQERFVLQFLSSVKHSRKEPGCIAFHIHSVENDPTSFVLFERWENQAAFDFHLEQEYTKALFESFNHTLARPVEECLEYIIEEEPYGK